MVDKYPYAVGRPEALMGYIVAAVSESTGIMSGVYGLISDKPEYVALGVGVYSLGKISSKMLEKWAMEMMFQKLEERLK